MAAAGGASTYLCVASCPGERRAGLRGRGGGPGGGGGQGRRASAVVAQSQGVAAAFPAETEEVGKAAAGARGEGD